VTHSETRVAFELISAIEALRCYLASVVHAAVLRSPPPRRLRDQSLDQSSGSLFSRLPQLLIDMFIGVGLIRVSDILLSCSVLGLPLQELLQVDLLEVNLKNLSRRLGRRRHDLLLLRLTHIVDHVLLVDRI